LFLYAGASEQRPHDISATAWPVKNLLDKDQYKHLWHVICTDNWYTSLNVLLICAAFGCHFLGTCKTNRSGIPEEGKFPATGRGVRARGTIKSMHSADVGKLRETHGRHIVETPVEAYFTAWQDNKPVHLLSSFKTHKTTVCRNIENTQTHVWTRTAVAIASVIKMYNWFMGGTDSMDQRLSYYRPNVKTVSWVPKMMIHFVNCSVVNAYILYKEFMRKDKKYALLDFLTELIDNLAEPWILQMRSVCFEDSRRTGYMTKAQWSKQWLMRMSGMHRSVIVEKHTKRAQGRIISHEQRGKCMMCRKDIATMCQKCKVYLCTKLKDVEPTCFDVFHDSKDL
jgi:hypothetical protein